MAAYIIPLIIIVFSNTLYQICSKSIPGNMEPFSALTVTYLVAAVFSEQVTGSKIYIYGGG